MDLNLNKDLYPGRFQFLSLDGACSAEVEILYNMLYKSQSTSPVFNLRPIVETGSVGSARIIAFEPYNSLNGELDSVSSSTETESSEKEHNKTNPNAATTPHNNNININTNRITNSTNRNRNSSIPDPEEIKALHDVAFSPNQVDIGFELGNIRSLQQQQNLPPSMISGSGEASQHHNRNDISTNSNTMMMNHMRNYYSNPGSGPHMAMSNHVSMGYPPMPPPNMMYMSHMPPGPIHYGLPPHAQQQPHQSQSQNSFSPREPLSPEANHNQQQSSYNKSHNNPHHQQQQQQDGLLIHTGGGKSYSNRGKNPRDSRGRRNEEQQQQQQPIMNQYPQHYFNYGGISYAAAPGYYNQVQAQNLTGTPLIMPHNGPPPIYSYPHPHHMGYPGPPNDIPPPPTHQQQPPLQHSIIQQQQQQQQQEKPQHLHQNQNEMNFEENSSSASDNNINIGSKEGKSENGLELELENEVNRDEIQSLHESSDLEINDLENNSDDFAVVDVEENKKPIINTEEIPSSKVEQKPITNEIRSQASISSPQLSISSMKDDEKLKINEQKMISPTSTTEKTDNVKEPISNKSSTSISISASSSQERREFPNLVSAADASKSKSNVNVNNTTTTKLPVVAAKGRSWASIASKPNNNNNLSNIQVNHINVNNSNSTINKNSSSMLSLENSSSSSYHEKSGQSENVHHESNKSDSIVPTNQLNNNTNTTTTTDTTTYSGYNDVKSSIVDDETPSFSGLNDQNDEIALRLGEFLSDYSLDHHPCPLTPRGLSNQSNFCYINATLQALLSCPPFVNLFRAMKHLIADKPSKTTPIIQAVFDFVGEFEPLYRHGANSNKRDYRRNDASFQGPNLDPACIRKVLSRLEGQTFKTEGRQEDAEEFLSLLLDGLHMEMIKVMRWWEAKKERIAYSKGIQIEQVKPADINGGDQVAVVDEEDADQWQVMGPKNKGSTTRRIPVSKSPISEAFRGQMCTALSAKNSVKSINFQPFYTLQLDISSDKIKSVRDALEGISAKEEVTGYNSNSGIELEAWRQMTLDELPVILILHLKRFVYDKHVQRIQKIQKKLEFPVDLDIGKDLLSLQTRGKVRNKMYKLFAVVNHDGEEATKGHYIADCFHPSSGSLWGTFGWLRFDDTVVNVIHEEKMVDSVPPRVPYLLYYRRSDTLQTISHSIASSNQSSNNNNNSKK